MSNIHTCQLPQSTKIWREPPRGLLNVPNINNRGRKPHQLSTMYCAIWLVDFWPITILVKYISIKIYLIALFYIFWSRTAQIRALIIIIIIFIEGAQLTTSWFIFLFKNSEINEQILKKGCSRYFLGDFGL